MSGCQETRMEQGCAKIFRYSSNQLLQCHMALGLRSPTLSSIAF